MSYQHLFTPERAEALRLHYDSLIAAANEIGYAYLFEPDLSRRLNRHFEALREVSGEFNITPGSAFQFMEDMTEERNTTC